MPSIPVGFITIGQTPRDDIVAAILAQLCSGVEPVQRGAIDGLSLAEVRALAPRGNEPWAVSRLRDGTEVRLAKHELVPRMQQCVDELAAFGAELIVPLCASDWGSLRSPVPFINTGRALAAVVPAMLRPGGTLGVVAPTADQARLSRSRYSEASIPVVTTFAQPYVCQEERVSQCEAAGEAMAAAGVDLVYMGCMGHTPEMRAIVRSRSRQMVITASGIITGLVAQALA